MQTSGIIQNGMSCQRLFSRVKPDLRFEPLNVEFVIILRIQFSQKIRKIRHITTSRPLRRKRDVAILTVSARATKAEMSKSLKVEAESLRRDFRP